MIMLLCNFLASVASYYATAVSWTSNVDYLIDLGPGANVTNPFTNVNYA